MNSATTVESMFRGRLFRVPDYQRSYAWTTKQLDDFLEDLDLLRAGKTHYTGTIVLHRRGDVDRVLDREGQSYEVHDIVDGQQRLTTIVLLLDAIRRELRSFDDLKSIANGIETAYLRTWRHGGAPVFKLTLNDDTHRFFADVVLSDDPRPDAPTTVAERRLSQARDHFDAYLERVRAEIGVGYPDWLMELFLKVKERLLLLPYEVADSAEVGVIFEVMNDRGKPLTELEKVKNYLLYLATKIDVADNGLAIQVNQTWARIFQRLLAADLSSSFDEDQLLRAHWLMAYDWLPRNWARTSSVKARLSLKTFRGRDQELLDEARAYVESLDRCSLAYCEILNPSRPGSFGAMGMDRDTVAAASERLLRLRAVASFLPVLMAARLRFPTDADAYLKVIDLSERFAFRVYRLAGKRSNAGQSGLFRAGSRLYLDEQTLEETLADVTGFLLYYSPTGQFEAELSDQKQRDWYRWYGLRYLLFEWEEQLAMGHEIILPWNQVEQRELEKTIEHILPQTPTDAYWQDGFTETQRLELTNDLGNLCLTEDNSSYYNKAFPAKVGSAGLHDDRGVVVRCYANSVLFQERAIAGHAHWGPDEIRGRRKKLLTWARQRWAVAELAVPVDVDEEADQEAVED